MALNEKGKQMMAEIRKEYGKKTSTTVYFGARKESSDKKTEERK